MFRWLNPVLFLGVALYVRQFNATHTDRQILFPLLEPLVGPDMFDQGRLTWQLCGGIGVLLAVGAVVRTVRERRADDDDDT